MLSVEEQLGQLLKEIGCLLWQKREIESFFVMGSGILHKTGFKMYLEWQQLRNEFELKKKEYFELLRRAGM